MTQPLQHQHAARSDQVLVVEPSRFFTPGRPYPVARWNDGVPQVRNDAGSLTWLVESRWWQSVPQPMTLSRSQELLHAAWRAQSARQEG